MRLIARNAISRLAKQSHKIQYTRKSHNLQTFRTCNIAKNRKNKSHKYSYRNRDFSRFLRTNHFSHFSTLAKSIYRTCLIIFVFEICLFDLKNLIFRSCADIITRVRNQTWLSGDFYLLVGVAYSIRWAPG